MLKKLFHFFSQPKHISLLNTILLCLAVIANIYWQAFCIPVSWAIPLLALSFIHTAFYPLLRQKRFAVLSGFINGISFCIFMYCIFFMAFWNFLSVVMIPFFGMGLLTYIPHFFAGQLLWVSLKKTASFRSKISFLSGVVLCLIASAGVIFQYQKSLRQIEYFKKSDYQHLDKNYFTERILGMHFIYHTRFSEFDGWRPPKHDPAPILGLWFNKMEDPLEVNLQKRLQLYRKFFPERKVKFKCSCAISYSSSYHSDGLWKPSDH